MRNVVQQLPLRVEQGLQTRRHIVEILPKIGHFVIPFAELRPDAGIQLPIRQAPAGLAQMAYGAAEVRGKGCAEQQAGKQCDQNLRLGWWQTIAQGYCNINICRWYKQGKLLA